MLDCHITYISARPDNVIEVKRVRKTVNKVKKVEEKNSSRFIIAENSEEIDSRGYIKSESISFCIIKKKSEKERIYTISIK